MATGNEVLTVDDLYDVLEELHGVRAKWHDLGGTLRVNTATLDAIKAECRDIPNACLREMLSHWLRQVKPRPCWNAIVTALRRAVVNEPQLAQSIEAKYCSGGGSDSSAAASGGGGGLGGGGGSTSAEYDRLHRKRVTIIETLADLGLTRALAEKLWSSGMIARRTYDEAKIVAPNVTEIDRATAVFNAVLASVKLNRAKYDKFVGTLKEVGGSDDLVAFIEDPS